MEGEGVKERIISTLELDRPAAPHLHAGDRVRFVSPSSSPDRTSVARFARIVEGWGLHVEIGTHAFDKLGFLAGTDDHRAADLNDALNDSGVRAIFATRGGKGAYRIAAMIDFDAARRDPKPIVGFSDTTILHLALWKHCAVGGVHGPDASWASDQASAESIAALRKVVMTTEPIVLHSDSRMETAELTTQGTATGVLIGGNLDLIATAAGWSLPPLDGAILFIEDIDKWLGHMDRTLTMLVNAGHLRGVRGVAVGHFTRCMSKGEWTYLDVLRDRLSLLDVPILGGLPIGHDADARTVPIGGLATLDATAKTLTVGRGV